MDNIMKKDSQNVALLIAAFLQKHNFSKTLAKLQKEANITVNRSGLEELESIFQKHIAAQTSASRKRKRVESSSDESSSDDSSSDESDSSESSTDDSSDDSEPEDFSKKREEIMKQKALDAKVAAENWMNTSLVNSPEPQRPFKKARVSGEAFRRVDSNVWINEVKNGLEDNSYIKTFGNDGYGAKANQILASVKGKDFRHEKTKKKRGGYRGGTISTESNSFKYSDE